MGNNRVFVLFGMTGAGKSFIAHHLMEKFNLRRIKNTTTRPQRGENDNEYNFTSEDKFLQDEGRYVAVRAYDTFIEDTPKRHYYGVDKLELQKGGILITDFVGFKELLERDKDLVGIYIYGDKTTRMSRSALRDGFKIEEFERRNNDDYEKFKIEEIVDVGRSHNVYIVENNLESDVDKLCERIQGIIKNFQ